MAKTKDAVKPSKDVSSKSVKGGNVGKASNAQSAVTNKSGGKPKAVKAASDSEDSETSDSSASSASESESEEESEVEPASKSNVKKANGNANGKAKAAESESEDDSESSEEESDDDKMDVAASKPVKANGAKAANKKTEESDDSEDDSEGSSDGSSDEDSEEEEKPAKATTEKKAPTKAAKPSDDQESDDSEEDSDGSSEEEEKASPKKRKADEEAIQPVKKSKVDVEDPSVSPNLFVGSLTWNVDEFMLREAFESFGNLAGVRVITDRNSGRSKGYGYVEFENAADAKKAYEAMKDTEIDGRTINLDYSKPKPAQEGRGNQRAQQYGDSLSEPSSTIFVGNVSFEADEEMLSEAFSKYGTITGVRLPTDQESGSLKGYGYVEFASVEEATTALNAMKGYNLAGRPLRLDFSTPRAGGGGGGRGGFNDRGGRGGGRGGRGGFNDRGRGGRGGRGGFNDRGGRGGGRGGRGGFSTNRGGFGDYKGNRQTFD